jgi:hypothetical protein
MKPSQMALLARKDDGRDQRSHHGRRGHLQNTDAHREQLNRLATSSPPATAEQRP